MTSIVTCCFIAANIFQTYQISLDQESEGLRITPITVLARVRVVPHAKPPFLLDGTWYPPAYVPHATYGNPISI